MKKHILHIVLGGLLASGITACRQDTFTTGATDEGAEHIYLSAGFGDAAATRTPYYPTDGNGTILREPSMAHPLDVSVWASTEKNVFPNDDKNGTEGTVAIHTDAHFQSGDPQLLGEAIYPKKPEENGTSIPVYFIGLHPFSDSWTATNENKSAQYTFTGKEDVMFAPQISGTYGTDYEQSPKFHFYHLLTWLRIVMVADKDEENVIKREAVRDAWGEIESISLLNTPNKVTINNLGGATEENYRTYVEFTSDVLDQTMNLYSIGTDNVFPTAENNKIPTSQTEVAYIMCAPVQGVIQDEEGNAVPEYTLHIKTKNREKDIPLDLKGNYGSPFNESTMGRAFTIVLNFKMGDVISISNEIVVGGDADWFTHGTGNGDLEEEDLDINVDIDE